jgi:hypothetical protein
LQIAPEPLSVRPGESVTLRLEHDDVNLRARAVTANRQPPPPPSPRQPPTVEAAGTSEAAAAEARRRLEALRAEDAARAQLMPLMSVIGPQVGHVWLQELLWVGIVGVLDGLKWESERIR